MNCTEPIGYLASALVLATFCMRDMVALRWMAITSNLAFIAYSALADVGPVLVLHLLLLPVNVLRLTFWRASTSMAAARHTSPTRCGLQVNSLACDASSPGVGNTEPEAAVGARKMDLVPQLESAPNARSFTPTPEEMR